jgi:hypothetical protein
VSDNCYAWVLEIKNVFCLPREEIYDLFILVNPISALEVMTILNGKVELPNFEKLNTVVVTESDVMEFTFLAVQDVFRRADFVKARVLAKKAALIFHARDFRLKMNFVLLRFLDFKSPVPNSKSLVFPTNPSDASE